MPSVTSLRRRTDHEVAHVVFIEGLPYCWTDHEELSGTAWVQADQWGVGRRCIHGLSLPAGFTLSLDLRDSGLIEGGHVEIGLIDVDGTLVDLFGSSRDTATLEQLGEPLTPGMKLQTLETLQGIGSGVSIDATDKNVAIERIGPGGERRWFWIFPEEGIGLDHPVAEFDANSPTDVSIPAVFVSDEPYIFAGRKVAIYEVHRDDDGSWKSWRDTYRGGGVVWFGAMRDEGELDGLRTWRIRCDGPGSWHTKALNTTRPDTGFVVTPKTTLIPEERGVAVWFWQEEPAGGSGYAATYHDAIFFVNDFASSDNTAQELADHVSSQVVLARDGGTGAVAASPDGGPYANAANKADASRWASFGLDRAKIKVSDGAAPVRGIMQICLHRKAWAAMGWDIDLQSHYPTTDQRSVNFYTVEGQQVQATNGHGTITVPGPGYVVGVFKTDALLDPVPYSEIGNSGADRDYLPQYDNGAGTLYGEARQQVGLGITAGAGPYLRGQNGLRPSQGAKIGAIDCDQAGLFLFKGVRRTDAQEEDGEEYVQLALCSWLDDGKGRMAPDPDNEAGLFIEEWLDPRAFGYPFKRLGGTWSVSNSQDDPILAYPLAVIGMGHHDGRADFPEFVHQTIGRMLLSTGRGSSSGSANLPNYTAGPNGNYPLLGYLGDFEIADLGLGYPKKHVDVGSILTALQRLPVANGPLYRGKYAVLGSTDSADLLKEIMGSRGMAMSLSRGDYGPTLGFWHVFGPWSPNDVVATIDASTDLAGEIDDAQTLIAQQTIRWRSPVDKWSVEYGHTPEGESSASIKARALDPGARARTGRVEAGQVDRGLMNKALWIKLGAPDAPDHVNWEGEWRQLHQHKGSGWYAKRHFPLTLNIRRTIDVGLGDLVLYTDELPASPQGEYGLTSFLARVIELERPFYGASQRVTLLVQAEPPSSTRHFAPIARVWGFDLSGGAGTLYCYGPSVTGWDSGNWSHSGGKTSDVVGFAEPSWSDVGGKLKAIVYQSFDGSTWGNTVTCDVESVDAVAHTITVSNISGTLLRDTEKFIIPRDYANQDVDSWPRALFGVHSDVTGKFAGESGWRFG